MIIRKIEGIDIPVYKANPKILGKKTRAFTFIKIYARDTENCEDDIIQHEYIHVLQQKELSIGIFLILYYLSWLINVITFKKHPYFNIIFEKEAYYYESTPGYLKNRPKFNWLKRK